MRRSFFPDRKFHVSKSIGKTDMILKRKKTDNLRVCNYGCKINKKMDKKKEGNVIKWDDMAH